MEAVDLQNCARARMRRIQIDREGAATISCRPAGVAQLVRAAAS